MTDTTAARPSWLIHPILAWRAYQAALADRADAEARAAGLTVQVLPGGRRRYRDPRLDSLAAHRTALDVGAGDEVEASQWSPVRLVSTTAGGRSR